MVLTSENTRDGWKYRLSTVFTLQNAAHLQPTSRAVRQQRLDLVDVAAEDLNLDGPDAHAVKLWVCAEALC